MIVSHAKNQVQFVHKLVKMAAQKGIFSVLEVDMS